MPAAVRLSAQRAKLLRAQFDQLATAFVAGDDPIEFVHRYTRPEDQEVAALFASALAFGRVASFMPVLATIFDLADKAGGPAAWVDRCVSTPDPGLNPVFYRWVRGTDLARFAVTIGRFRLRHGSFSEWIRSNFPTPPNGIRPVLSQLITEMRDCSVEHTGESFADLSRGFKHLLPHPSSGSACKRWCMLSRWMVRTERPDLGLWPMDPQSLIIPLDTHVHRIARMVGLTRRTDGSWRTAAEITSNLKRIDPVDPIRFDFVLAHLGIDGRCKGKKVDEICNQCMLLPVCKTGRAG